MRPYRTVLPILFALLAGLIFILPAAAQEDSQLTLRMSRDFGYAAGNDIQGTFSLKAAGPEDLSRVVFYLDGETLGEVTQAPFNLRFTTDVHPTGPHTLSATGYTTGGQELHSNEIKVDFVSADEGWQTTMKMMIPVFAILFGVLILAFVSIFLTSGKQKNLPPGTPRKYGLSGGAICSRCQRPFAIHFFAFNMVAGKLDRCPYCGKWGIVRSLPIDMLRAAEAAELEDALQGGGGVAQDEQEKLRKDLENSRYQDDI
ncbi:MAG: hypothetical protein JXB15_02665 [Anaerolineales bacterium]|nr:hypothetical protein [Anaerolineales bacterium]